MSENLHDIDDLFRSALEANEEKPSASVKESLVAHLDKKDAESYKKRFIGWKRAALVLLLFLTGFILYESGVLKTRSGDLTKKVIIQKTGMDTASVHNYEIKNQNHTDYTTAIKEEAGPGTEESVRKKVNSTAETIGNRAAELNAPQRNQISDFNTIPIVATKTRKNDEWAGKKNYPTDTRIKSSGGNKKQELTVVSPSTENGINSAVLLAGENSRKENRAPAQKINPVKITDSSFINLLRARLPATIDSFLSNSRAISRSLKKTHYFKPYWTLAGLITYERVNYKLDSELPDNIKSVKHREVHEPSFSGGILATRQLTKKWGLQTGMIYSITAIGISPQKMYAFQDPVGDIAYKYITSSGYAYIKPGFGAPPVFGDSLTTAEAKHTLEYISVPVVFKYKMGKNKFYFTPGAGIEADFITKAKVEVELIDASNLEIVSISKLRGARSFYWSWVADAEIQYQVNEKLSVSMRPSFRYALSPITKNNVVKTFPYSFGTGLGLTYKF